jgi:DNA-binding response OmpR family regulator
LKILVIEDESLLAESITAYLKMNGYLCEIANNYIHAEDRIACSEYDCILVDIGLPDGNGLELIKMLKKIKSNVGILIITAKNSIEDKITGLELGADDYLTKPFHLSELNARIKSILRRRNFSGNTKIQFNEITIDTDEKKVYINNQPVTLTRKEYDMLLFLIANKNRIVTKESLIEHLWDSDVVFSDSLEFIYTHIKNLRNKIHETKGRDYIKTVYGIGYKFSDQ